MNSLFGVLILFLCLNNLGIECGTFNSMFPPPVPLKYGDSGEPLFLTPYIEKGQIAEAKNLSRVRNLPDAPSILSYSGYLTVNKKYDSNMFFWFFPPLSNAKNAPVLLWLQGGPGGSSMFGLFVENGPFIIGKDLKAMLRKYTWATNFAMLYIDNPVGTGFSFTKHDAGYARNEEDVARDLYEALQQFFTLFSEYRNNDFYVTGESYAGKYVPAIVYKIYSEGSSSNINLKGMAIGDGLTDPELMLDYADYLYQVGLADDIQRQYIKKQCDEIKLCIQQKQWKKAFNIFDEFLNGDTINGTSYFTRITGMTFYYNILHTSAPDDFQYYSPYLAQPEVRKAIHVGNLTFNDGSAVEQHLLEDVMQSVKPWVTEILNNKFKVMIYNGQLDIIVAFPLVENYVMSIPWKYGKDFVSSERSIWKISSDDKEVAGYVKQFKNLQFVMVRNAGHILPYDQPRVAFDMINRFVRGKPFKN